jgi:hypothetical protein
VSESNINEDQDYNKKEISTQITWNLDFSLILTR